MKISNNTKAFSIYLVIVLIGSVAGVATHEFYHVIMHWGKIIRVQYFVDGAIVKLTARTQGKVDTIPEEIVAYAITAATMAIFVYIGLKIALSYLDRKNKING